jgi:hypothetical protein
VPEIVGHVIVIEVRKEDGPEDCGHQADENQERPEPAHLFIVCQEADGFKTALEEEACGLRPEARGVRHEASGFRHQAKQEILDFGFLILD